MPFRSTASEIDLESLVMALGDGYYYTNGLFADKPSAHLIDKWQNHNTKLTSSFLSCVSFILSHSVSLQQMFIGNKFLAVMSWRLRVQCSSRRQRECPISRRFIDVTKFTIWITRNFHTLKLDMFSSRMAVFLSVYTHELIMYLQSLTFTHKIYSCSPRNGVFILLNYMSNQSR